MTEIDEFWARCCRALPHERLGTHYSLRRMGNGREISEALLGFVAAGQKSALFSRPAELEAAGLTPSVGDYVVFTDYEGRPRCLVRMEECKRLKFSEIGPEHTAYESPAARELEVWRGIHRRYWTPSLAAEGIEFGEHIPVLFQRFKLLYSEGPGVDGAAKMRPT
jgi:uncharacterized protein YhfF